MPRVRKQPWFVSAKSPALLGDATLVPPTAPQNPSKYTTTLLNWLSAGYEMSGTARWVVFPFDAGWYAGFGHCAEYPPPPAPNLSEPPLTSLAQVPWGLPWQPFQTDWFPTPAAVSVVPPALITSGCEPGSSTANCVSLSVPTLKQSSEPESPAAAITVCPCRAMRWKMAFSVSRSLAGTMVSQFPQLVVTTWAASSLAIRLNRSKETVSPETLGAWYTTREADGALNAASSVSSAASPCPD